MKQCKCGRLATHAIVTFDLDGNSTGKKLACDAFPRCRPVVTSKLRGEGQ